MRRILRRVSLKLVFLNRQRGVFESVQNSSSYIFIDTQSSTDAVLITASLMLRLMTGYCAMDIAKTILIHFALRNALVRPMHRVPDVLVRCSSSITLPLAHRREVRKTTRDRSGRIAVIHPRVANLIDGLDLPSVDRLFHPVPSDPRIDLHQLLISNIEYIFIPPQQGPRLC